MVSPCQVSMATACNLSQTNLASKQQASHVIESHSPTVSSPECCRAERLLGTSKATRQMSVDDGQSFLSHLYSVQRSSCVG